MKSYLFTLPLALALFSCSKPKRVLHTPNPKIEINEYQPKYGTAKFLEITNLTETNLDNVYALIKIRHDSEEFEENGYNFMLYTGQSQLFEYKKPGTYFIEMFVQCDQCIGTEKKVEFQVN